MTSLELCDFSKGRDKDISVQSNVEDFWQFRRGNPRISKVDETRCAQKMAS